MSYVDLHVHSNASDCTLSPEQVVRLAHEAGLSAIALTDHDTTAGVAGAAEAGQNWGWRWCPASRYPAVSGTTKSIYWDFSWTLIRPPFRLR